MINEIIKEAENRMRSAVQVLEEDLAGIRTGRASPALVEKLSVDYYGSPTPLVQLASISIPEPRQIMIKPFDITSTNDIERAIQTSDLGLTPMSDGKTIRLNLPPLTEDRRKELVRLVQARVEEARISIRNIRRDAIKDMREFEQEKLISQDDLKRGEEDAQKSTDEYNQKVDDIGEQKEKEVMEV